MTLDTEATILETPRLSLRKLPLGDRDTLAALYADKEIRPYFPNGIDGTLTYAETKEEIEWIIGFTFERQLLDKYGLCFVYSMTPPAAGA